MTLLLTLANSNVIHQSSDYRISDRAGNAVNSENGNKQLSVMNAGWTARVVFTGIACDGAGYRTLDWLRDELVAAGRSESLEALTASLASRGTAELRTAVADNRRLTLLVSALERGKLRLFMLSNFEQPRQNQLARPLGELRCFELDLSRPTVLVNGAAAALRRWELRCLERVFRDNPDPQGVRDRMAAANKVAAQHPLYTHKISEECWVDSLFADGTETGRNYGQAPGIPGIAIPGFDVTNYLINTLGLRAAPGQQIKLVQVVGMHGQQAEPAPGPVGDGREVWFSTGTTTREGLGSQGRTILPRITFEGRKGCVTARKNEPVIAVLGTVTLEIDPSDACGVSIDRQRLPNAPTVDGAEPPDWAYDFDLHGCGDIYTLEVRTNCVALRAANFPGSSVLSTLGPTEELLLTAPTKQLLLYTTAGKPKVSAEVVAVFLIRDFPELAT